MKAGVWCHEGRRTGSNRRSGRPPAGHPPNNQRQRRGEGHCWLLSTLAGSFSLAAGRPKPRFKPDFAVGEPARLGRRRPRPRGRPLGRGSGRDTRNGPVRPDFPRGRGKLRPGRARSMDPAEFGFNNHEFNKTGSLRSPASFRSGPPASTRPVCRGPASKTCGSA